MADGSAKLGVHVSLNWTFSPEKRSGCRVDRLPYFQPLRDFYGSRARGANFQIEVERWGKTLPLDVVRHDPGREVLKHMARFSTW